MCSHFTVGVWDLLRSTEPIESLVNSTTHTSKVIKAKRQDRQSLV